MRQTTLTRRAALLVAGLFVAGVLAALSTGGDARDLSSPRLAPSARGLEGDPIASTRVLLATLPAAREAAARPLRPDPEPEVTRPTERAASRRSSARRASPLVWPAAGPMTGWWGEGRDSHTHLGIDIDGETGDAVWSAGPGRVVYAGPASEGYSGYGLMVIVDHGGGQTLYAHLSRIDASVGDIVDAGTVIGAMGATGNVTGSHLHFELRINGRPVDPAPYLPAR